MQSFTLRLKSILDQTNCMSVEFIALAGGVQSISTEIYVSSSVIGRTGSSPVFTNVTYARISVVIDITTTATSSRKEHCTSIFHNSPFGSVIIFVGIVTISVFTSSKVTALRENPIVRKNNQTFNTHYGSHTEQLTSIGTTIEKIIEFSMGRSTPSTSNTGIVNSVVDTPVKAGSSDMAVETFPSIVIIDGTVHIRSFAIIVTGTPTEEVDSRSSGRIVVGSTKIFILVSSKLPSVGSTNILEVTF